MTAHITIEEQNLMEKRIFLPFAKRILEKDREEIEKSNIRFKERYYKYIELCLKEIGNELFEVKKQMLQTNMKVWEINKEKKDEYYRYKCIYRGYQADFPYWKYALRDGTEKILSDINKRVLM